MKRRKILGKRISTRTHLNEEEEEQHSADEIIFSNENYQIETP
jgi:hypothetical protein